MAAYRACGHNFHEVIIQTTWWAGLFLHVCHTRISSKEVGLRVRPIFIPCVQEWMKPPSQENEASQSTFVNFHKTPQTRSHFIIRSFIKQRVIQLVGVASG